MSFRLRLSIVYLLFALMVRGGLLPLQGWVSSGIMTGALLPLLLRRTARRLHPGMPLAPGHPLHVSALLWMSAPLLFACFVGLLDAASGRWLTLAGMGAGLMMLASLHSRRGLYLSLADDAPSRGLFGLNLSWGQDVALWLACLMLAVTLLWDILVPRSIEAGMRLGQQIAMEWLPPQERLAK